MADNLQVVGEEASVREVEYRYVHPCLYLEKETDEVNMRLSLPSSNKERKELEKAIESANRWEPGKKIIHLI
tara:strand:- start:1577 stop:1792 length:216 start_codon:yes stop_codon:yes gene_type:complete